MFKFLKIDFSGKKSEKVQEELPADEIIVSLKSRVKRWKLSYEDEKARREILERKLEEKNRKIMDLKVQSLEKAARSDSLKKRLDSISIKGGLDLETLSAAFENRREADQLMKAVFFLIEQRSQLYTVDLTDGQGQETNQIIFKNGAAHSLKALGQDIQALLVQDKASLEGVPTADSVKTSEATDPGNSVGSSISR